MRLRQWLIGYLLLVVFQSSSEAVEKRPFTFEEMIKIQRVSDPQLSPDGRWVAFTVTVADLEKNTLNSDLWLVPASGGEPRQITQGSKNNERPRWSPDSKRIVFVSNRSGISQLWILSVDSGEVKPVNTGGLDASGVLWSPDGKNLAFVSNVYPDCPDISCNLEREKQRVENPIKARTLDRLLYRHWNSWKDGKRSHLFVIPVEGGIPRDLSTGDYDVPPFSLGGPDDYAFSPDGREICFARNIDKDEALSTNKDLFVVPVDRSLEARQITTNAGADQSPLYSPDGQFIAFRSQQRSGYEADCWRLLVYDRKSGSINSLTRDLDHSVESFVWSPDSKSLYMIAGDQALYPVYQFDIQTRLILSSSTHTSMMTCRSARMANGCFFCGKALPHRLKFIPRDPTAASLSALTRLNQPLLSELALQEPQSIWFEGSGGTRIQTWIVTPPGFDPKKKYPLLLLVHGGPQQVWSDSFHYRWNANIFANQGYVVLMPNPRGSVTFGQRFTDEIRDDWGGKAYQDLMKAVDHVLTLGYVDPDRMAAGGASYGGYMVNWIAGHTDRFKCLVSHAGTFNLTSMYGVTEELWFPEWELKGSPWTNRQSYDQWSPDHFVKNFRTPMLVIHGELDFRVPVGEGFQLFTALQRQKIPSKMLYFPDEGHWITKPKNSQFWYQTFIAWLDTYLK